MDAGAPKYAAHIFRQHKAGRESSIFPGISIVVHVVVSVSVSCVTQMSRMCKRQLDNNECSSSSTKNN